MLKKESPSILIIEPHVTGHRGPYVAWMSKGLADKGLRVIIITRPEAIEHPSINTITSYKHKGTGGEINVFTPQSLELERRIEQASNSLIASQYAYWQLFNSWYHEFIKKEEVDAVFVPYIDYCLYAIGLLGSPFGTCPWGGLAMRPSFHYKEMGIIAPPPSLSTLKKTVFLRVLRNPYLRTLLTIDEPLKEYFSNNPNYSEKLQLLPEPIGFSTLPNAATAKRQFGLSINKKTILVYGSLTTRKGIREILQALSNPGFPPDVEVLFAGNLSDEATQLIRGATVSSLIKKGKLHIINRFIGYEEEAFVFATADIIWLGYCGHYGPSGVLVQAASSGIPVIASKQGIIGWQTKRHNLGVVINPNNTFEIIEAVKKILIDKTKNSPKYASLIDNTYPLSTLTDAIYTLESTLLL